MRALSLCWARVCLCGQLFPHLLQVQNGESCDCGGFNWGWVWGWFCEWETCHGRPLCCFLTWLTTSSNVTTTIKSSLPGIQPSICYVGWCNDFGHFLCNKFTYSSHDYIIMDYDVNRAAWSFNSPLLISNIAAFLASVLLSLKEQQYTFIITALRVHTQYNSLVSLDSSSTNLLLSGNPSFFAAAQIRSQHNMKRCGYTRTIFARLVPANMCMRYLRNYCENYFLCTAQHINDYTKSQNADSQGPFTLGTRTELGWLEEVRPELGWLEEVRPELGWLEDAEAEVGLALELAELWWLDEVGLELAELAELEMWPDLDEAGVC